jgi:hypothetical protein
MAEPVGSHRVAHCHEPLVGTVFCRQDGNQWMAAIRSTEHDDSAGYSHHPLLDTAKKGSGHGRHMKNEKAGQLTRP